MDNKYNKKSQQHQIKKSRVKKMKVRYSVLVEEDDSYVYERYYTDIV